MHALITNDDGVEGPGLRTLVAAAVRAGLDCTVAAPAKDRSGSSASLTVLAANRRLLYREVHLGGDDGHPAYAVEATPAFIVLTALQGAFGPRPDLVLSGVNQGPNTGVAVLHSGTVGAVLTAVGYGCPGVAFSLSNLSGSRWDTSEIVLDRVLGWMVRRPADAALALNVNVPDVPPSQLRGLTHASLASFGAVQGHVGTRGSGWVTVTFDQTRPQPEAGTDAALLDDAWATVTALRAPCDAPDASLVGLLDDGPLRHGR